MITGKRIFYLTNSEKIFYYNLDTTVLNIIKPQFKEVYIKGEKTEIAEVNEGSVLKANHSYLLYNSIHDLERVCEAPLVQHQLTGLNPYGDKVFENKEHIISAMFKRLLIDEKKMNYKIEMSFVSCKK